MKENEIYLGKYPLQKDCRIRLPHQVIFNMNIDTGTIFNIYYNPQKNEIILKVNNEVKHEQET